MTVNNLIGALQQFKCQDAEISLYMSDSVLVGDDAEEALFLALCEGGFDDEDGDNPYEDPEFDEEGFLRRPSSYHYQNSVIKGL